MNSHTPVTDGSDQHEALHISTDPVHDIAAPFEEAANNREFYCNPLWAVTIALACLFALLACLVATG